MTKEEIESFEKVFTQLMSFHQETAVLVKKDPDGAMNKFHEDHYHYENNMLSWDNEGHWK